MARHQHAENQSPEVRLHVDDLELIEYAFAEFRLPDRVEPALAHLAGLRLGVSAGFIGAILAELKITPTGVGDIISYSRSIADYPSMYAAIASIIVLAVLFLNLLERLEKYLFKGVYKTLVSD